MTSPDLSSLEQQYQEINHLIKNAIDTGIVSDKNFESIRSKIGKFDDATSRISDASTGHVRVVELKNHIDAICIVLDKLNEKKQSSHGSSDGIDSSGDYFKDDNTFRLSQATKTELEAILKKNYNT